MVRAPTGPPEVEQGVTVTMDGSADNLQPRRDVHTPAQRSFNMSRIRGKDTKPELALAGRMALKGWAWESHARDLPGRPDFVFREQKVAIFVDGDFWHGWRFADWSHKLTPAWEAKISANRKRDRRNRRALLDLGYRVVRIWEHQLKRDPARCVRRVAAALRGAT
jgi:DNA mismatch endonuclease (patch repair protein)